MFTTDLIMSNLIEVLVPFFELGVMWLYVNTDRQRRKFNEGTYARYSSLYTATLI